jgi:hypothetical protein
MLPVVRPVEYSRGFFYAQGGERVQIPEGRAYVIFLYQAYHLLKKLKSAQMSTCWHFSNLSCFPAKQKTRQTSRQTVSRFGFLGHSTANEGDVMVRSVCLRMADFLRVMWHNARRRTDFFWMMWHKTLTHAKNTPSEPYWRETILTNKIWHNTQKEPYLWETIHSLFLQPTCSKCFKMGATDQATARKYWSDPKTLFVFVIHLNLAKPITNTLKSC